MRKKSLAFTLALSIFTFMLSFEAFAQGSISSRFYIVLEVDESIQLRSMSSATSTEFTGVLYWSSYDNEVASVNNSGLVTAVNIGAVQIFYSNLETLQRGFMNILVVERIDKEIDVEVPELIIHRLPISILIPANATSAGVPISTEFIIEVHATQ